MSSKRAPVAAGGGLGHHLAALVLEREREALAPRGEARALGLAAALLAAIDAHRSGDRHRVAIEIDRLRRWLEADEGAEQVVLLRHGHELGLEGIVDLAPGVADEQAHFGLRGDGLDAEGAPIVRLDRGLVARAAPRASPRRGRVAGLDRRERDRALRAVGRERLQGDRRAGDRAAGVVDQLAAHGEVIVLGADGGLELGAAADVDVDARRRGGCAGCARRGRGGGRGALGEGAPAQGEHEQRQREAGEASLRRGGVVRSVTMWARSTPRHPARIIRDAAPAGKR
ncbi:MAG: hypothetical protein U0359_38730 [Byssovorax sp.]